MLSILLAHSLLLPEELKFFLAPSIREKKKLSKNGTITAKPQNKKPLHINGDPIDFYTGFVYQ